MSFLLPAVSLWSRELTRFRRQPGRIIGALGTPLIFWLLIGSGIGKSFRAPGDASDMNYLEYFYPGTILLVVLFTSIFSTFSVIEDKKEGFLQSVLVAPVSRLSIVVGKVLGGTTVALVQGLLLVLLAPWFGIEMTVPKFFLLALGLFAISFWLTAAGYAIAWKIRSSSGFHSVMNLLLMPMWLLSGALFPFAGAAGWVQWIMRLNPLTYGLALVRDALYWNTAVSLEPVPSAQLSVWVTVACVAGATIFALRSTGREKGVETV